MTDDDIKATTLLRYRDLVNRGIVSNWVTLKARIDRDGFPRGRMIGKNARAWTQAEIEEWIDTRPVEGPAPRGAAAAAREAARAMPGARKRGRPRKVVAEAAE